MSCRKYENKRKEVEIGPFLERNYLNRRLVLLKSEVEIFLLNYQSVFGSNLTKKLFFRRVNDEVGRQGVLPLEAFAASRANEGRFARMLRQVLKPALKAIPNRDRNFDALEQWTMF